MSVSSANQQVKHFFAIVKSYFPRSISDPTANGPVEVACILLLQS